MESLPSDFVVHNLPFIVLSGLATSTETDPPPAVQQVLPGRAVTNISSEIPPVQGDRANELLQEFLSADGTHAPWNARGLGRRGITHGFRIRSNFQLPPQKADAPTNSETTPPGSPAIAAATSWVLHSPISPLSPGAPSFPDGVIAPAWVAKHQHYVPSVYLSFFNFTTDPITNSLHDNQLKTEINKIKGQIQKSNHRTKYVVVLLSDKTILEAPDIEDRLAVIRRATGLDPKNSLFFLPPRTSRVELQAFVTSILAILQPICVEYYRDLTKHARRKKGRGTVPPPTAPPTRGTSQTLSYPGWGVRYDFKLGVFAEFRQEMDAAQRHYSAALEALFGPEGLFETTASWSPRWDEIRLLSDIIALRHIRCQLWNNYPTSAVQTWLRYKYRLQDVLDRRGKGSANYGWQAWESTWAQVMAQVVQRTELPVFKAADSASDSDPLTDTSNSLFSQPEKQVPVGERILPWELLHHAGYWHKIASDHAKRRYLLAREMPEEDRTPPGMSPAAKVSNRSQIYDSYLVPQPHEEYPLPGVGATGFEHWKDISSKMNDAIAQFKARAQHRKVDQLQLEVARTLLHAKRFDDAFKVLRPLWETMAWRKEGWWSLASEVVWALHECALRVQGLETYVATEWELYSQSQYSEPLNCMILIDTAQQFLARRNTVLNAHANTTVSASFAFSEAEGNVGEPLQAQIAITSNARPGSAPITLSFLQYQFNGGLAEVRLKHETDESAPGSASRMYSCTLEEAHSATGKPRWAGASDLTLYAGQTKVYSLPLVFRESGDVDVVACVFGVSTPRFDLVCSDTDPENPTHPLWWIESNTRIKSRSLKRGSGMSVHILPKPPKMEISLPDVRNQYYTDEPVTLAIQILNQEEEDTEAVLEVRLLGRSKDTLGYTWVDRPASSPMKEVPPALDGSTNMDLPGHVVGKLSQGARTTERIRFTAPADPADYALEVKVLYHVLSDRDIPISKIMVADLVFNAPFEASYDLNARVHPDPWPSYFSLQEAESNVNPESSDAFGIAQKWGLRAKVASFADEQLIVSDLAVQVHGIHGGATCDVTKEFAVAETPMEPQVLSEWSFSLDIRKNNLEERRSTALDTTLNITWQRTSDPDATPVTSSLPIPRIQIPSSEPRVLASSHLSTSIPSLIHLDYVLENPTMHFLTFELAMEASEDFGFSGAKLRTLHLLPMSRQTVRYNLLSSVEGDWITPNLKVTDRYFNKTLKVQATEGMKGDKKGVSVWVPGDESEGAETSTMPNIPNPILLTPTVAATPSSSPSSDPPVASAPLAPVLLAPPLLLGVPVASAVLFALQKMALGSMPWSIKHVRSSSMFWSTLRQ
ncbi:Gryzun trafficking through golgi-like protein [Stemphylium lycopersici]|uniref:Gryzun trafficking through golgi-like protein n=1 Tax=Stemphylium lycopersici TaxID=183478 RepID=A0A364N096_STELY|nr:Gryzun trafficking through golgi-like protein [Stemphylium lycopersici]